MINIRTRKSNFCTEDSVLYKFFLSIAIYDNNFMSIVNIAVYTAHERIKKDPVLIHLIV